ncbi:MAG: MFS transporter [Sphingobium sp.]|nr:MFS transporter [Sphingobium sp.]
MLWLAIFVALAFPMYGAQVMNNRMIDAMHLDRKMLGLGFSIFMLMVGLPGPLVAVAINRYGARRTIVSGNLLILAGALALATVVQTGLQAALVFGLVVGGGVVAGGLLPAQTLVSRWFKVQRPRALAIMLTASGAGGFVAPPLLNAAVSTFDDWRAGWVLLAILAGLTAVVAALLVREDPAQLGQLPDGALSEAQVTSARPSLWTVRGAVRTPLFWTMAYASAIFSCGLAFMFAHGVAQLRGFGQAPGQAAITMALVSLVALVAKVVISIFGSGMPTRVLWALCSFSFGAGLLLLSTGIGVHSYMFVFFAGIGIGVTLVPLSSYPAEIFGREPFPALMGIMLIVQTIATSIVPFSAGAIFDATGSYAPAMIGLSALFASAGALLLLIRRIPDPR